MNEIIEISDGTFYFFNEIPHIKLGGEAYELTSEAMDALLSFLKIPKKYLLRFADEDYEQAAKNVNFWMNRAENIGGMVDGTTLVKVLDSRKLFLPSEYVVSSLKNYYKVKDAFVVLDGDTYIITVPSGDPDIELSTGEKAFISVRIMLSECFEITPRIDAVLTVRGSYENYYYQIRGRKFRIVGSTIAQVDDLIREFSDIVMSQIQKDFIPKLEESIERRAILPADAFIGRLCSELRLSRRVGKYLLYEVGNGEYELPDLVKKIGNALMPEIRPEIIDLSTARDIELALSKSIMKGAFK